MTHNIYIYVYIYIYIYILGETWAACMSPVLLVFTQGLLMRGLGCLCKPWAGLLGFLLSLGSSMDVFLCVLFLM